jgi:Fe-Mn family superoxide dismutase
MYKVKNYEHLLGMDGFSDELLKNHFKLYEGYVKNMNKLNDVLVDLEKEEKWGVPEFAELNRRLAWEWNGMRLHELYFSNLQNADTHGLDTDLRRTDSELAGKITAEWGSFKMWEKDFQSMGVMRGIGWVVLYFDKEADRMFNVWINEHDLGHLAGAVPLLVMDVFEHAYFLDYSLNRKDYVDTFMKNIDWTEVQRRFKK